ncbi:hypothetical protein XENOCAPTIV_002965 [Xenoophorus captivus]|uniref:Uncharacterized protein n=1 Tax=Xenoophorus captivus TaxID=1517983 RepID=A0ABV0QGU5_9TELE
MLCEGSSGIQLQAGTEFIYPAPLCLSLIQSSIHPTSKSERVHQESLITISHHLPSLLSIQWVQTSSSSCYHITSSKINSLTFSLSPECSLHVGQILKQKDDSYWVFQQDNEETSEQNRFTRHKIRHLGHLCPQT